LNFITSDKSYALPNQQQQTKRYAKQLNSIGLTSLIKPINLHLSINSTN